MGSFIQTQAKGESRIQLDVGFFKSGLDFTYRNSSIDLSETAGRHNDYGVIFSKGDAYKTLVGGNLRPIAVIRGVVHERL